jgi:enamine deaminase RidA (YjgF/YER057c/UK114 family)
MEVRGAQRLLFVSGTMGLDEMGKAGALLDEQLILIWSNLRRILAEAGMTVAKSCARQATCERPVSPSRTKMRGW